VLAVAYGAAHFPAPPRVRLQKRLRPLLHPDKAARTKAAVAPSFFAAPQGEVGGGAPYRTSLFWFGLAGLICRRLCCTRA
jgi:hypothetical protein